MTRHRLRALAASCAAAVLATTAACASIPTSGDVVEGSADVDDSVEIGFNAQGPVMDSEPEQIVEGFVSATQLGPASASNFTTAQEYTTPGAWQGWERYTRVLVLSESPQWIADEHDDDAAVTSVHGEALVVASLNEDGVYTELPEPSTVEVSYDLTRGADGQWRISGLENGLLVLDNLLSSAFHRTTLYFPTPDREWWVPDVRWYPGQSWRTAATQAILAGPPEWLAQSAVSVVPEGTALAIDAVTVAPEGSIDVSLTSAISTAPAQDRALIVAQLEATLREGEGRSVVLSDGTAPLAVTTTVEPSRPLTVGDAVAVVDVGGDQALRRVVGRELTELADPVSTQGLDITAVGAGTDDGQIVVRDGDDRLVRVTGEGAPVVLLEREGLLAPSLDRFGDVWTARGAVPQVVLASGDLVRLEPEWLVDRTVRSLRVSPEGARAALVVEGPDGSEVLVTGIERDADDVPTGLSSPVRVGATVTEAVAADWSAEDTLVLLGGDSSGTRVLHQAGIGGLEGTSGGETRQVTAPTPLTAVASGVGASPILTLGPDGVLQLRQSAALWPEVALDVDAVAYPG